ncbi:uncharacterized protein BCR38DRAFT_446036 [Pseudomassariella vexata]|uniref:Uncharacterized protein n=1 Tax=Pseudomassariella vexata TaxID=1141098 RepID=A0A1Y2DJ69_9PEZI|nr:uncharacterized protein BCR38DRAFT_446036 [Pseudomassariella vexata]ORY59260.1 hypothetical protein BCR38DRAFT_446036 [Pseudomassariella vexata]
MYHITVFSLPLNLYCARCFALTLTILMGKSFLMGFINVFNRICTLLVTTLFLINLI